MRENENKTFNAVVDRIEGSYAVCEMPYETMVDIEISKIPFLVKEGDRLLIERDEFGSLKVINKIPKENFVKRVLKNRFIRFT